MPFTAKSVEATAMVMPLELPLTVFQPEASAYVTMGVSHSHKTPLISALIAVLLPQLQKFGTKMVGGSGLTQAFKQRTAITIISPLYMWINFCSCKLERKPLKTNFLSEGLNSSPNLLIINNLQVKEKFGILFDSTLLKQANT